MDRVAFLARLRERLGDHEPGPSTPAPDGPAPDTHAPDLGRPPNASGRELAELFAARLGESGGVVEMVASRAEAWAALERLAGERGWRTVACVSGLLQDAAVDSPGASADLDFTVEAGDADFGLCEADWAIAETGSVVVKASVGVRRGYSLIPSAVGFFVPLGRLRASIGDVLRELPAAVGSLPSCVSFVSGPSGTSDLAAVHVVGVHGPGEVLVWVIQDASPSGRVPPPDDRS